MKPCKRIYTLSHPITGEIVYVGACIDLYVRVRCHVNDPSERLKPWIDQLKSEGLLPTITEVARGDSSVERLWIKKISEQGHRLLNKNGLAYSRCLDPAPLAKIAPIDDDPYGNHADTETLLKWAELRRTEDAGIIGGQLGLHKGAANTAIKYGLCRVSEYVFISDYYNKREAEQVELPAIFQENIQALLEQIITYKECAGCRETKANCFYPTNRSECCAECHSNGVAIKHRYVKNYLKERAMGGSPAKKAYNERNKEKIQAYMKEYHKTYKRNMDKQKEWDAKRRAERQFMALQEQLAAIQEQLSTIKKSA